MDRPSFPRGPSLATAAPTAPPLSQGGEDLAHRHKRLREQHAQLNENRVRRSTLLQQATEEDERCRQAAAAFGANTPEELERVLEDRRRQAQEEMDAFEKALQEEAALQERIEQDLQAAENR